jgi:hypothetical protein
MSRDYDPDYVDTPGEYDPDPTGLEITPPIPHAKTPAQAVAEALGPATTQTPFEWQKTRKRADAVNGPPVRGFGPKGGYTLWLPSPMPTTAEKFEGGKFTVVQLDAGLTDVDLLGMRKEIIDSTRSVAEGVIKVKPLFMDYAAGLIRRNYTVTDEELSFLLLAGDEWHNDVFEHCLGGPEIVSKLAEMPLDMPISGVVPCETAEPAEDYTWRPERPKRESFARRGWRAIRGVFGGRNI